MAYTQALDKLLLPDWWDCHHLPEAKAHILPGSGFTAPCSPKGRLSSPFQTLGLGSSHACLLTGHALTPPRPDRSWSSPDLGLLICG